MTVGEFGAISHHAQYEGLPSTQLESVPICSTFLLPSPSIPTQVAESVPAWKDGLRQFATGTVQLADAAVKLPPVAT